MPNIAALLKDEITRLSRRVLRQEVDPLRRAVGHHRHQIAALKKQVQALEREIQRLRKDLGKGQDASALDSAPAARFQARGLVSLRKRLDLSAEDFGRLVQVSAQSVYNWEAEKTVPRPAQISAIASLRGIGKKEARARLEQLAQ